MLIPLSGVSILPSLPALNANHYSARFFLQNTTSLLIPVTIHSSRITDVVSEDDHGHMSGTRGIGRNKHAQGLQGECADEEER